MMTIQKRLLDDIQMLKGILIFLVVWGHVYDPNLPAWALVARHGIYAFHMPVFMFVTGYVFCHSGMTSFERSGGGAYALQRAQRLLLPFVCFAILISAGKILVQQMGHVDKQIDSISAHLLHFVVGTEQSGVLSLWYLIVAFYFVVFTPLCLQGRLSRAPVLFAAALVAYLVWMTCFEAGYLLDVMYFNKFLQFYVFFMLGFMAKMHEARWIAFVERFWMATIPLFMGAIVLLADSEIRYLVAGALGAVVLHGLARRISYGKATAEFLGSRSFVIYLLNLPFIGVVKASFIALYGVEGLGAAFIVTAVAAGVVGPIAVKHALGLVPGMKPVVHFIS